MRKTGNCRPMSFLACLLPPAFTALEKQILDILMYHGLIARELASHSGFLLLCAQCNFFP